MFQHKVQPQPERNHCLSLPTHPGTYTSQTKSASCTECPRGSYQKSYGQRKCELCPIGTYGDSRGRNACKVCPVGTYNPNCGSVTATSCV
jgi:hypothetical protein